MTDKMTSSDRSEAVRHAQYRDASRITSQNALLPLFITGVVGLFMGMMYVSAEPAHPH